MSIEEPEHPIDRCEQEAELRFLRSIVSNANDAILVTEAEPIDEPRPRIVYINGAFTRMTGYAPEEVVGTNFSDYVHPEDVERALEAFAGILNKPGGGRPVELRARHKDGSGAASRRWVATCSKTRAFAVW